MTVAHCAEDYDPEQNQYATLYGTPAMGSCLHSLWLLTGKLKSYPKVAKPTHQGLSACDKKSLSLLLKWVCVLKRWSCLQERNVYKAKWQQLLSQHGSAQTAVERLQKDVDQQSHAYADLQKVNQALESRLLGHRPDPPATAAMPAVPSRQAQQQSRYESLMGTTSARDADSPDSQGRSWQPRPTWASPARNSPHADATAAVRHHDIGCPGSPDPTCTRQTDWSDSTGDLDSLLAEHQHRVSPSKWAAEQITAPSPAAFGGTSHAGLSSEEIMARLTRSPDNASARKAGKKQDTPLVFSPSTGLQSPPDTDTVRAALPTEQLRTALFGSASTQHQPHGVSPAAATTAAALQRRDVQQMQSQERASLAQSSPGDTFAHHGTHHYHSDNSPAQARLHTQQEVLMWHNARPWSAAACSAKVFSLHTNPLAEPTAEPSFAVETGLPAHQLGGAKNVAQQSYTHAEQMTSAKACDLPLSLSDLAAIDPNSL